MMVLKLAGSNDDAVHIGALGDVAGSDNPTGRTTCLQLLLRWDDGQERPPFSPRLQPRSS